MVRSGLDWLAIGWPWLDEGNDLVVHVILSCNGQRNFQNFSSWFLLVLMAEWDGLVEHIRGPCSCYVFCT